MNFKIQTLISVEKTIISHYLCVDYDQKMWSCSAISKQGKPSVHELSKYMKLFGHHRFSSLIES